MKIVITLLMLFCLILPSFAETINMYDKYENKTSSFKSGPNGNVIKYDRYGNKEGYYTTNSDNTKTHYDRYGNKESTLKLTTTDKLQNMTITETKHKHLKREIMV